MAFCDRIHSRKKEDTALPGVSLTLGCFPCGPCGGSLRAETCVVQQLKPPGEGLRAARVDGQWLLEHRLVTPSDSASFSL